MKATRQILGWLSWYLVATVLYAIVWTQIDTDFRFAMPADLVLPVRDFLGARSAESTYDVYVWSTSIVAVVCLHLGAYFVWCCLKTAGCGEGSKWKSYWRLVSAIVGWMCWLLVSTAALLVVGDEISEARGVRPSGDPRQQSFEFVVGVLVVALLHLVGVTARRQHAAWRRGAYGHR